MKFKIIVDSSSNLLNSYYQDKKDVAFKVVPLTIRIGQEEFIDNDELDVNRMLDVLRLNDGGQSSCPSPNDYLRELDEAEYSFIITITSKLSGSFNSACVARTMCKNPEHVFVIDSKGTAGSIVLIAEKLFELIKENKEFSVITNEITAYRNSINLLFALDRFDNLVRNGRMSKLTAFIAEKIAIKPLCYADDGEIKIKEKIRTFRGVIKRMTHYIGKMCEDTTNKICIIAHTRNESAALELKKERLDEVRKQLKKYLKFQYNCTAANMLKAERDKLKAEIKKIEASRERKASSIGDNPEESKIILEHNQIGFDL